MPDIADEGNEINDLATDRAIAKIKDKIATAVRIEPQGYCLNPKCADDLNDGRLFCNAACAKQYEIYGK